MIRRRIAYLENTVQAVRSAAHDVARMFQSVLRSELDRLKEQPHFRDPRHLIPYGGKVYSQCDEDGMIAEIFRRIGTTNKCFVEFGIGNGLENNTLALLFDNWQGLWIEASEQSVKSIEATFSRVIHAGRLKVVRSFITKDNIDRLIAENIEQREIDLLSVDLDGNDYHVLSAIKSISPRVIVIEYNAKFAPPLVFCMDYDAVHVWSGSDCFGASLKFLEVNLRNKGYSLVGCNLAGANAFFLRADLVSDKFLEPFTAENHYQPARYHLIDVSSGHPASYDTLAKSLQSSAVHPPVLHNQDSKAL
jgi:hypothetical protein